MTVKRIKLIFTVPSMDGWDL